MRRRDVDAIVPGARVDVDAAAPGHGEGAHVLGPNVVAVLLGAETDNKWRGLARPEELSAVGMVVGHPQIDGRAVARGGQIDRWLDRTVSAAHCPAVLAPLAQGGELAPSKKLMAAAKLSRGSSLLRWRRRGNLRQEPEVDDGVVWHIRVAPGAWRAVITELVAQGKDVACDFFFERK